MAMYRFKEVRLPRETTCGAIARRLVEQDFANEVDVDRLYDLKAIVSELVGNAYFHGQGQIRLRLLRQNGSVRVEVMDEGDGSEMKLRRAGLRTGGHGLAIIDALSTRWGVYEGSTHVWAELASGG